MPAIWKTTIRERSGNPRTWTVRTGTNFCSIPKQVEERLSSKRVEVYKVIRRCSFDASSQPDFWPELSGKSMVIYARLAGAGAPARKYEDGRARTGESALGNPALNPDSFCSTNTDVNVLAPANPDNSGGHHA